MAKMEGGPISEKRKITEDMKKAAVIGAVGAFGASGLMQVDTIHAEKNLQSQVEQAYAEQLHMEDSTKALIEDLQEIIKEKGGIDFDQPDFDAKLAVYLDRYAAAHKLEPGAETWARAMGEAAVAAMQNHLPPATVGRIMNEFRDYSVFAKADREGGVYKGKGDLTPEQSAEYEKLSETNAKDYTVDQLPGE